MTQDSAIATITCPHCAARHAEPIPVGACLYFYPCTACGVVLRPRPGECCVFCSYGDRRCPTASLPGASADG